MNTLIRGGQVCLDAGIEVCDVLFNGSKIVRIGKNLHVDAECSVYDADGCYVLPGMIDFHVHMDDRIGGFDLADTYQSGSQAAVLAGITTLIGFVTQDTEHRLSECIQIAANKVKSKCCCDVAFHLTPTRFGKDDWRDVRDLIEAGYHTFKFYTTYREAGLYQDYDKLKEILSRIQGNGVRVLVHAEDQSVLDAAAKSYAGANEPFAHTKLRPPEAEVEAITKLIELSRETDVPVHIVHVSTVEGARLIQEAHANTQISCETAPQYLLLNEQILKNENGYRYLCTPPLRSEENRQRMEELAAEGCFDIFATDHCAFTMRDKDKNHADYLKVPNGLAGTGALFPLMYELLVEKHNCSLCEVVKRLSKIPAQLAGLFPDKGTIRVGADADLVMMKTNGKPRAIRSSNADCYETYPNQTTTLDIRFVFVRGNRVVEDNRLVNPESTSGQVRGAIA
ncbi:amidohydrolase family protein [bacterium]|nr:amidohydrolase family protein [bacterium]MBU1636751.1 amidohydrolase family protein [bacterium]MBU1920216.1 amidohydrolase family protein [bacterium]